MVSTQLTHQMKSCLFLSSRPGLNEPLLLHDVIYDEAGASGEGGFRWQLGLAKRARKDGCGDQTKATRQRLFYVLGKSLPERQVSTFLHSGERERQGTESKKGVISVLVSSQGPSLKYFIYPMPVHGSLCFWLCSQAGRASRLKKEAWNPTEVGLPYHSWTLKAYLFSEERLNLISGSEWPPIS